MKQYTRVYCNAAGDIIHIHTQGSPIKYNPVDDDNSASFDDAIVDTGDADNEFIRARELIDSFELDGTIKPNSRGKIKSMSVREPSKDEVFPEGVPLNLVKTAILKRK